jgi:hypothetical protein
MKYAKLSFDIAEREGLLYKGHLFKRTEAIRTVKKYIDIFVDGASARKVLDIEEADVITPYFADSKSNLHSMLTALSDKNDLPSNIAPIYVCPECGDYGCGVFGWKIDVGDKDVRWHGFQWDDNLEEESDSNDSDEEANTMELYFDKKQYFDALRSIKEIEDKYNLL